MLRNRFSQKPEKTFLLVERGEKEREEGEKESKAKQFIRENPVVLIKGNTYYHSHKMLIKFLTEGLCCKEEDLIYRMTIVNGRKVHFLKILPLNKEVEIIPKLIPTDSPLDCSLEIRLY